ncbi:MAG TPA: hypothetical protein VIH90_05370 [Candidatus Saccharimonadales bacterium]
MSKTKINKVLSLIALVALVAMGFNTHVVAAGSSKNNSSNSGQQSQSVTQSYNADSTVDIGMLVRLKPGVQNTVEALPMNRLTNLLGVAVQQNSSSFALTPQSVSKQQIFVATSGRVNVLVSDQNGPIITGDYVSISAINGVAMKADGGQSEIIGKAALPFTGNSNTLGTASITNTLGKSVQVSLGMIPVDLAIASNPLAIKSNDYVPSFLSKAATAIATKPVSAARIYISFTIILVASFLTASMIYSGVRSGMIAVGRNPLSKKSIIRSLTQTVIAGLIIFLGGIFGVYLLLKL